MVERCVSVVSEGTGVDGGGGLLHVRMGGVVVVGTVVGMMVMMMVMMMMMMMMMMRGRVRGGWMQWMLMVGLRL